MVCRKYEINAAGQILADPEDLAAEAAGDRFSRYNGGWIKNITGLNKKVTTGYSILGEWKKGGKCWNTPGVYLDCSIDGSRKNQHRHFTLFILKRDGSVMSYGPEWKYPGSSGGDWAVEYWPSIEEILKNPQMLEPDMTELEILKEKEAKALRVLEKIQAKIRALEEAQAGQGEGGQVPSPAAGPQDPEGSQGDGEEKQDKEAV